jgi:hypothetical protein
VRFELHHDFPITPEGYFSTIGEPAYDRFIEQELSLRERKELSRELVDGVLRRTVRVIPERDLPPAFAKLTRGKTLAYNEIIELDTKTGEGSWRVEPDLLQQRLKAGGTFRISAAPGGCSRNVQGEIKVGILGAGPVVERFIVAQVKEGYDNGAVALLRYLEQRSA